MWKKWPSWNYFEWLRKCRIRKTRFVWNLGVFSIIWRQIKKNIQVSFRKRFILKNNNTKKQPILCAKHTPEYDSEWLENDLNCIYKMKKKVSEAFFMFANEKTRFRSISNLYKMKSTFSKHFSCSLQNENTFLKRFFCVQNKIHVFE